MLTTSDTFTDALTAELARWRLRVEPSAVHAMRSHFVAMVEVNRRVNLTRITDPFLAAVKHYADSLALLRWIEDAGVRDVASVLDIGTGAGFPAVPLAVTRRDWTVIAIDGTKKKVDFLARWAQSAEPPATTPNASNLTAIHAHSSQWTLNPPVDLVVCRALAPLARCIELAVPFLHAGGRIAAYKSRDLPGSEEHAAAEACHRLNLSEHPSHEYELRAGDERIRRSLRIYLAPD